MRTHLLTVLFCLCLLPSRLRAVGAQYTLTSPDGQYSVNVSVNGHRMTYAIDFAGENIVRESEVGIELDNRLFEAALGIPRDELPTWSEGLRLRDVDTLDVGQTWQPLYGENATVRDHYRQLTLHLVRGEAENRAAGYDFDKRHYYAVDLEVRAYDEGVALRFHFPEQANGLFLNITGERTQMRLPEGTVAWHQAWAQDKHALCSLRTSEPCWQQEAERPLLLRLPSGTYVALLEAAMRDYARGKFRLEADNTLAVSLYGGAEVMSPYNTPWRVVMAGKQAVELINHKDLVLNLNEPAVALPDDGRWIRPGKVYRCGGLNRNYILRSIRFAEERGLQFIELDARWYGPEMSMQSSALAPSAERDFTIPEVCDSARAHGLGVWLYVNQRALYQQLDSILPLYRRWGVSGLKFGFVQVGNQMWSHWLHEAVRRCADYGLMVDIHDEYRPTGLSRTLPNLMNQEGIAGQEEMPTATHNVTLPFTRLLCGPADYTPSYYCPRKHTTFGHQLAMAAVYYAPIEFLFWYDDPVTHDGAEELRFWHNIPTVFDESRALAGAPGEYIVQARRSGREWFVGAMTNEEARVVTIPTDFLEKGQTYQVTIYNDDPTMDTRSKVSTTTKTIKRGKPVTLHLQSSGGAALHIVPA